MGSIWVPASNARPRSDASHIYQHSRIVNTQKPDSEPIVAPWTINVPGCPDRGETGRARSGESRLGRGRLDLTNLGGESSSSAIRSLPMWSRDHP